MVKRYKGGVISATQPSFVVGSTSMVFGSSDHIAAKQLGLVATYPGAPTIVSTLPGNSNANITISAPASDGGTPILSYTAVSSPDGITASNVGSIISVPGLTNGTAYTVNVYARNSLGLSTASIAGPFTPSVATFDILAVAGGAGGGGGGQSGPYPGGGGGAGGYYFYSVVDASSSMRTGTYTITVGAGGSGGATSSIGTVGSSGGNTVVQTTGLTFTTIGGGGGAGGATTGGTGADGGSGGGGSGGFNSGRGVIGTGKQPTSTTGGYGNDGGLGQPNSASGVNDRSGGGGGGAGGVGQSTTSAGSGGTGGIGAASPFPSSENTNGQLVSGTYYFAGGGGGASAKTSSGGPGGSGGGGAGRAGTSGVGTAGTANTGGGGGAGHGSGAGGAGGSGIVIIRYPSSAPAAASTTGSPTITTAGSFRYYVWTTSGSITF